MGEETDKLLSSEEPMSPLPVSTGPNASAGSEGDRIPSPAQEKGSAGKSVDEPSATPEEQEEKLAEAVEEAEEKKVVENRELIPPLNEEPAAAPFVEESYYVKDLKVSEKKALQDFKAKIEEAINSNTFLAPSATLATGASREVEADKEGEEATKDVTAEAEETLPAQEVKEEGGEKGDTSKVDEEVPNVEEVQTSESLLSVAKDDPSTIEKPSSAVADEAQERAVPIDAGGTSTPPAVLDGAPLTEEMSAPATEEEKTMLPPSTEVAPLPNQDRDVSLEAEEEEDLSLEDLSLWGVPLAHSKGDERTDVVLLKFLRARDFKVNDAMSMLKDTILWRKDFKADDLIEEETTAEFDSVAYMYGVDKEGHPVCYNHYGVFQDEELYQKTFGDEAQFNKFLRWRIQVLERGMQKLDFSPNGVHSIVQVIDLKNSPGFVKRRNITKKALTVVQDNYPELAAKQIFVNVPWYFGALYALHGRLITDRSKSKVVIVRPEKVTETLFKYIAVENLPVRYGGFGRVNDGEFGGVEAPVQEVVVKPGEKQSIELPEQEVGSTMVWDVAVLGWDVAYGEEFVPSGEGKYTVVIQKPKKVTAAEEPMRNSFKATTDAGRVVITVDNTSGRRKRVVYRHTVKQQQQPDMSDPPT